MIYMWVDMIMSVNMFSILFAVKRNQRMGVYGYHNVGFDFNWYYGGILGRHSCLTGCFFLFFFVETNLVKVMRSQSAGSGQWLPRKQLVGAIGSSKSYIIIMLFFFFQIVVNLFWRVSNSLKVVTFLYCSNYDRWYYMLRYKIPSLSSDDIEEHSCSPEDPAATIIM